MPEARINRHTSEADIVQRIARRHAVATQAARDSRDKLDPPPALVHARLRRTALVPAIITIACEKHGAEVGAYCYRLGDTGGGVCADRIIARAAKR